MGGDEPSEGPGRGGRTPGKIDASLDRKQKSVGWGEYRLGDLFEIQGNPQLNADSFVFREDGAYPYFTRTVSNNGIFGYVDYLDEEHKIRGNCLAVGMIGMQFFYMEKDFYAGQFTKRAVPRSFSLTRRTAAYFISILNKKRKSFQNLLVRQFEDEFNNTRIQLPTRDGRIDFEYMEDFIAELEEERAAVLSGYLSAGGLRDYRLTEEEEQALRGLDRFEWKRCSLEELFGSSTRGKRLKSADRIAGELPFVTAGEADEGVSAYIGNNVEVFSANTTTIDMFGSAKYRNYRYGADDHVAVVHTEALPRFAAIFVTAAIHKASHTGRFDYSRNFYAKDADELEISLPFRDNEPDYAAMETLISAVHKLVIKDVVLYSEKYERENDGTPD